LEERLAEKNMKKDTMYNVGN